MEGNEGLIFVCFIFFVIICIILYSFYYSRPRYYEAKWFYRWDKGNSSFVEYYYEYISDSNYELLKCIAEIAKRDAYGEINSWQWAMQFKMSGYIVNILYNIIDRSKESNKNVLKCKFKEQLYDISMYDIKVSNSALDNLFDCAWEQYYISYKKKCGKVMKVGDYARCQHIFWKVFAFLI